MSLLGDDILANLKGDKEQVFNEMINNEKVYQQDPKDLKLKDLVV